MWYSVCGYVAFAVLESGISVDDVPFTAGAESTISSAMALLYILANHPDVQQKAQTEIDSVVGLDRLPLMTDVLALPYTHAIIKEVGRWFTVVPLGEFQAIPKHLVNFMPPGL